VYLVASGVNTLLRPLPAGTAYFIGIVLITMCTGQLVHHQGSLARAALPYVVHLRWGWHRGERAMERGKFSLDALFDSAFTWCLEHLPVEPVRLGRERRSVQAVDSSTLARWRSGKASPVLGKGYCQRAQRAVRANIVAALTSVVRIRGVRVGLVRRARCGKTCEAAVAALFRDVPPSAEKRLLSVDAGIATREQFAAATEHDALVGRLRKNVAVRRAPLPHRRDQRGRPPVHGSVLHPGTRRPEGRADEDTTVRVEDRQVRVRRWNGLHFARAPQTVFDIVRVDDPAYKRPLIIGTTARELMTDEIRQAYGHRWPIETNFFVAQGTCAMEQPRAWTATAVSRRITLALLCGSLLKAIAAACEAVPMGPWDRTASSTAGRLANHLDLYASHFAALALSGLEPRNYVKTSDSKQTSNLPLPKLLKLVKPEKLIAIDEQANHDIVHHDRF
jgi:hypothetical protein